MQPRSRLLHFSGLLLGVLVWLANASNPPNGNTGAPFDGHCNNCHGGASFGGSVSIDGLPATITPNTTYPLTITLTPTSGTPGRGGFQLVVVDDNNSNSGNLTNSNAQSGTEFSGGREYLEHRGAKVFGGNPISWSFTWASPATAAGNMVNFYFVGNFCNGTGSSSGDIAYDDFLSIPFGGGGGGNPVSAQITSSSNVTCFGGNNGSATVSATGGSAPLTYQWNNGQTQATAVNLSAGTYTVTVTGGVGNTATASVTITQPANITASAIVSGQLTCNNTSVNVTANVNGGAPPYDYAWSNGDNINPASYSTTGPGSVTITDNNGCTKTASFNVTGNLTPPTAAASAAAAITCNNPTISLSGSGSSTGATYSYLWSASGGGTIVSGGTTLSPTVSGCGTYAIQVRSSTNGCTASASVTPTCNVVLPNLTATGNTLTCNNSSVTISASSTTPGVSFTWSGPNGFSSTQASPTVSVAGTYTVTATTTANGCSRAATVSVTNGTTPPGATATGGTLTCNATSINLQGGSPTQGVTYQWSGPGGFTSNQQNPAVSVPGIYTLTTTNPTNSCTSSATATVVQNTTPPGATATGGVITCARPSITLGAISASVNVTYHWTGPGNFNSNLQNPVATLPGTYTVVVTQTVNGCTSTATAVVTTDIAAPNAAAAGGTITCAAPIVTLQGNSTTPGATFSWAGPGGFSSNLQNPTALAAGTYTLTVLNPANGCTAAAAATVNLDVVPPTPTATGGTLTCAAPVVTLSATSNVGNAMYIWTGPNGFSSATPNTAVLEQGIYTLVVLNPANGCTAEATATVLSNTIPPGATATGGTITCIANSVTLSGNSATTGVAYAWSGPNNYTATGAQPSTGVPGNYILTVTDPVNGCTSTATAAVNLNTTPPDVTTSGGQLSCAVLSTQVCAGSGTAGLNYVWIGPGGFNATQACTIVTLPGTYTVIALNPANGCTNSGTVQVTSNTTVPTVTIAAPDSFHCNVSTVVLDASASAQGSSFSFAWTTANGAIQSGNNTALPVVSAPGTYQVVVTNGANGCTASGTVTVIQVPALNVVATASAVSCNGGSNGALLAAATGGVPPLSYGWSNGATGASISNLLAGAYTATVTDAKGCTTLASAVVSQPDPLQLGVSATPQTISGVNDGTATASATGGTAPYTYLWSNGQTNVTITGLAPGSYTVTTTDANNCSAIQTANVNAVNCNLIATATAANITCNGAANGTALVSVAGANGTESYLWSNGATTAAVSNLSPGTYTVTVSDALLCSQVQNISISEPAVLATNVTATGQTVVGQNNGAASAAPTGGTPPYTYLWSNTETTASITGLAPGLYTLSLTDQNGCSSIQTVAVSALSCALTAVVNTEAVSCFGGANGAASVNVNGSTGTLLYRWNNGATTPALTSLQAGTYTVTAADANGCTQVASGVVSQPALLQLAAVMLTNVACPLDPTGQASFAISGGTAPYNLPNGSGYPAGTYTVTATDANACTATTSFTIVSTDTQAPTIICPPSAAVCAGSAVFYNLPAATDNCAPVPQIALISGQPSGSNFSVGVTLQVYRATDLSGNTATCSFAVTVHPVPVATYVVVPDTNNTGRGAILVAVVGGTTPFSYTWTKNGQFYSNQKDITQLSSGSYSLEIVDANGCVTLVGPVTLESVVGTNEVAWLNGMRLYPNPANTVLNLDPGKEEIQAVRILTLQGRLAQIIPVSNGLKNIQVDALPAGSYYLQVIRQDGKQGLIKWVKGD